MLLAEQRTPLNANSILELEKNVTDRRNLILTKEVYNKYTAKRLYGYNTIANDKQNQTSQVKVSIYI